MLHRASRYPSDVPLLPGARLAIGSQPASAAQRLASTAASALQQPQQPPTAQFQAPPGLPKALHPPALPLPYGRFPKSALLEFFQVRSGAVAAPTAASQSHRAWLKLRKCCQSLPLPWFAAMLEGVCVAPGWTGKSEPHQDIPTTAFAVVMQGLLRQHVTLPAETSAADVGVFQCQLRTPPVDAVVSGWHVVIPELVSWSPVREGCAAVLLGLLDTDYRRRVTLLRQFHRIRLSSSTKQGPEARTVRAMAEKL